MDSLPQSLEAIALITGNKENLRRLTQQAQSPLGVVPFVGAGLSMPFGFPGWIGFLLEQAKRAGIEDAIQRRVDAGDLEQAADDLVEALGRGAFHNTIHDTYGEYRLIGQQVRGAVAVLPRVSRGPVITTNFDRVLEWAFAAEGSPFEEVIYGPRADQITSALHRNRRLLLKVHGDTEERTERILTKDDFEKAYGGASSGGLDLDLPLPRLMKQIVIARPLLFLGCSLHTDRTIRILEQVLKEYPATMHYAVVERPLSEEDFHKRARTLSNLNICPVWYPFGEHEQVEQVLVYLQRTEQTAPTDTSVGERPARSVGVSTNLPTMYGEFVGRESDVEEVQQALSDASWPVVCIEGFGGIGKTTLASRVARQIKQRTASGAVQFDAIAWISTRSRPDEKHWLDEVLNTVAEVLGYQNIEQAPHNAKKAEVNRLLAGQPSLIVIDNFETIDDPELNDWIQLIPEPSKVLITTRPSRSSESLHNVWRIPLSGLDDRESLLLIRRHAHRLGLSAILSAPDPLLNPLVEISQGSPFIIELALGYIKRGKLSLQQVVQRLSTADETMDSIFNYLFARAWELMSRDARRLLMIGPLFIGPATRTALAAASGLKHRRFNVALEQLVELGLLNITAELDDFGLSYGMHPLTRAFAQAKLRQEARFESQSRVRWSHYYLDVVIRNVVRDPTKSYYWNVLNRPTYPELDANWLNIRNVLSWAASTGQREILCDLVQLTAHYMNRKMLYAARTEYAEKAAEAAHQLGRQDVEAWMRVDALGWVYIEQGRFVEAIAQIQLGIAIANAIGLDTAMGSDICALSNAFLARALLEHDDVTEARSAIAQTNHLMCQPIVKCRVDMVAGDMAMRDQDVERAIKQYKDAIAVVLAEQDVDFVATLRYRLGTAYLSVGRLIEAEQEFARIVGTNHEAANVLIAYALFGMARVAQMTGDEARARQLAFNVRDEIARFIGEHQLVPQLEAFLRQLDGRTA